MLLELCTKKSLSLKRASAILEPAAIRRILTYLRLPAPSIISVQSTQIVGAAPSIPHPSGAYQEVGADKPPELAPARILEQTQFA